MPANPAYSALPLTVECRVKLLGNGQYNILVANETKASATHWELFTMPRSGIFRAYLPGRTPDHVDTKAVLTDGRWHRVGMILEETRGPPVRGRGRGGQSGGCRVEPCICRRRIGHRWFGGGSARVSGSHRRSPVDARRSGVGFGNRCRWRGGRRDRRPVAICRGRAVQGCFSLEGRRDVPGRAGRAGVGWRRNSRGYADGPASVAAR